MTFDDRCILTDGCGEKVVDGGPPALAGVCFAAMMLGLSALSAIVSLGAQAQAASLRQEQLLGYSVLHRPITATEYGAGPEVTLVLGGMEGDEPVGSYVVQRLEAYLDRHDSLDASVTAVLVPRVNPDGLARDTRVNARGVDINRNFSTADWRSHAAAPRFNPGPQPASEPETRIVIQLISRLHPCQIITIHAPFHQLNIDGPAMALARAMQQFDHYRITTYIGYQTPGSLGTYAGKERHIPVVTLELPPVSGAVAWAQNRQALLAGIDFPCRQ
jgi:murein peptide amidase A